MRTRIKTESFERLLTAAIGEVLWTRKLLPSECFETVEFEATFAGAPKGTLHRISPVDEVTSRVKAGKLFRWAKDACSAVKQKVLAKFAICYAISACFLSMLFACRVRTLSVRHPGAEQRHLVREKLQRRAQCSLVQRQVVLGKGRDERKDGSGDVRHRRMLLRMLGSCKG